MERSNSEAAHQAATLIAWRNEIAGCKTEDELYSLWFGNMPASEQYANYFLERAKQIDNDNG